MSETAATTAAAAADGELALGDGDDDADQARDDAAARATSPAAPAARRFRLAPMPAGARLRLWLSYQRYAALLLFAPLTALVAAAWLLPWWAAVLLALPAIAPLRFSFVVAARWPRKLRATQVAMHRQRLGRFEARSVRAYCGDPCFRVVAGEILARAGISRRERRRLIRQFATELRDEERLVVYFDHRAHGPLDSSPAPAGDRRLAQPPTAEEMT